MLCALAYADDIVLLADSMEDLQKLLDISPDSACQRHTCMEYVWMEKTKRTTSQTRARALCNIAVLSHHFAMLGRV